MITKIIAERFAQAVLVGLVLLTTAWTSAHAGTVTYYYTDPQGTPLAEADAQGNIIATFDYRPYGSQALGTPPKGPGYTGHVNDPDTGLVYMKARYYDPISGRFVSADPVKPNAGNVNNLNRYAYANNNLVMNIDPDGRQGINQDIDGNQTELTGCCNQLGRRNTPNRGSVDVNNDPSQASSSSATTLDTVTVSASQVKDDANTGLNVTNAALSAYMLRVPRQIGYWQTGDLAISHYVGATWKQMARSARVGRVANGVAFLSIGASVYALKGDMSSGDGVDALGAGSDLAWSLIGMTGPVGAVGSTAYGVTSLLVQIPAVNKVTVQPVTDLMCSASPNCL
jgi:RHS repeat-associated protein